MPGVLRSEVFTYKDVPEVSAAVDTLDLRADAIWIGETFYCAGYFLIKAWPATVCLKLVLGAVKFSPASFADVGSFVPKCIVFTCKRHLCAFLNDDLFLFRCKFL